MKKWTGICLLCLLCLLTACGQKQTLTDWTAEAMVRSILASQETAEETRAIARNDALFDTYAADYYALRPEEIMDGAVAYAGGVSALEAAVVRLADGADPDGAVQALTEYINSRAGAFAGYAPEQYAILEGARVVSRGQYVALLICPDVDAAEAAFNACFESPPPEPEPDPEEPAQPDVPPDEETPEEPEPAPEVPWSYDEQRILDAWNGGSRDGLREQDLAILETLEGIPALTDSTLTDYERELALHDWMIGWAEYDPGALTSGPIGEPMPDNDNPYGFMTGRKGICLGYASTFQLLMDLSGIECITVHGTAHAGTAEHAWNLVRLDGEWYAVDTTWDDPVASFQVSESTAHSYFNVTDDFLRKHDHQWEEGSVPAAEGMVWTWS